MEVKRSLVQRRLPIGRHQSIAFSRSCAETVNRMSVGEDGGECGRRWGAGGARGGKGEEVHKAMRGWSWS